MEFAIYGAGGMGKECAWISEESSLINELAFFLDDNTQVTDCLGKEVLHKIPFAIPIIISIANPNIRKNVVASLGPKQEYINLISKSVRVHSSAVLGLGNIMGFNAIVSCDVKVGSHCLLNAKSIIGHDSIIGDFVSIMYNVNVSGNVKIGDGTLVGSGAVILQGKEIGKNCVVGAGAVVTQNIPDNSLAVGVPAIIKKRYE